MKINGGKYRGKTLFSPQSAAVRPTSDRLREAAFNILRSRLGLNFAGKVFLDVFAGSGAMGLEALSQGFTKVCFFEKEPTALLKNLKLFPNETARIKLIKGDVLQVGLADEAADVLFADAPYKQGLTEPTLARLSAQGYLKNGALCLIEVEKNESCQFSENFELIDERTYGAARLIIAEFKA